MNFMSFSLIIMLMIAIIMIREGSENGALCV